MKIINALPPEVKKGQFISFDFEMFQQELGRLHRPHGTFACISIAVEGLPDVYQLYDHNDLRKVYSLIKKGTWVCHNALYDLRQFKRYVNVSPRFMWDTMLADQSMQGGLYQTFGLDDLVRRWLGRVMPKDEQKNFGKVNEMTPAMKQYAADDAMSTLEVALKQREEYEGHPNFAAYLTADEPMIFPVLDMQGFSVDVDRWLDMVNGFQLRANQLEDELEVNVMSHVQVKAKAKTLGLNLQNTSATTLAGFLDNKFIQKVIEARMYRKAVSTYGEKWLNNVESDGKVYADYHITGASMTGRLSCSNPNMQNIPQRKLPQYRDMFIASKGSVIAVEDIAQQEPCITAYETKDQNLIQAIINKEDLHLSVARNIFDNPKLTKKNKEERSIGKAINLGTSYGLTAYGLSSRLDMPLETAEKFISQYFRKYRGVFSWIQSQRQAGYARGYVQTALGRRSFLNTYNNGWENNAINSPIQGGAADFSKVWVNKLWKYSNEAGIPFTLCGMVHDEVVRDIPKKILKESKEVQARAFQDTAEQLYPGIPFTLESEYGTSWSAKNLSTVEVPSE